ncbi:MAG: DUF1330 domain-containing protein [Deferrisomatales bacterium]
MSAHLVGHIRVRDPELWKEYVGQVPGTLAPFGGEVVFRGRKAAVLSGELGHDLVVVLRFPDQGAVRAWYGSAAYQALIPVRDAAADLVLVAYDDVS